MADVYIDGINRATRKVLLRDGTVLDMVTLCEADGEEVDDIEDATFATVHLPNGKWTYVMFSDYSEVQLN